MLIGYAIGCGAGLLVAILAHRDQFLSRGLLPLGNFFSALPLVGVAPIMVMWFGFDWPSKAAVVVLVTFFPMLVNAIAGLSASGHIERDLMRYETVTPTSMRAAVDRYVRRAPRMTLSIVPRGRINLAIADSSPAVVS